MEDKLDGERANRAANLAVKIMSDLEMDGEDPSVIFSIFAIGSSVCAQIHEVKKERYLEACGGFYDETTEFLTDIGILGDEDES
jgi:hypothetical protein